MLIISWFLLIAGVVINIFYNELFGTLLTASGIFMVVFSFQKIANSYKKNVL